MKTVIGAVAVLLMVGSRVLAGESDTMPQAARDALVNMDEEIGKAKTAAIAVLKKLLQEEMKKGNLTAANMIQEKIDELTAPPSMDKEIEKAKTAAIVVLKKLLQEEMDKGNLTAANMIQEKIDELSASPSVAGKWTQEGTPFSYDFKDNGDVLVSDGNRGKWKVNKSKLSATFPNGTMIFDLPSLASHSHLCSGRGGT